MNWLAAVIRRVSSASSVAGKALCPVCSHALTSASVVRSTNATESASHAQRRSGGAATPRHPQRLEGRYKAMSKEVANRFGRNHHVAEFISRIFAAAVAASGRVGMMQLDRGGRRYL